MTDPFGSDELDGLDARNYCVSFIDLLGQRDALRGQSVLPVLRTSEEESDFYALIKRTIGSIYWIQSHAEGMVAHMLEARRDSPLRAQLPEAQRETWDRIRATRIHTQRWSDGVVSYVSLGDDGRGSPMNGLFGLIGVAGTHVLLGLAGKTPIRGAIELAWGVELRPGELYGPAIAQAYELESSVAGYPRIVIGPNLLAYLRAHASREPKDDLSRYSIVMAEHCMKLFAEDNDGHVIVDYLGSEFRQAITQALHNDLYQGARDFILKQLEQHKRDDNRKLENRYRRLLEYFEARQ